MARARRVKTVAFVMPDGSAPESMAQWDSANAQGSEDAYTIKKFDNGRLRVRLVRLNRIENVHIIPDEHQLRFEVEVWNIISTDTEGRPLAAPKVIYDVTESKKFSNVKAATTHYERILVEWTDCHVDASGKLREVGNLLIPPAPDAPTIASDSPLSDAVGSW